MSVIRLHSMEMGFEKTKQMNPETTQRRRREKGAKTTTKGKDNQVNTRVPSCGGKRCVLKC